MNAAIASSTAVDRLRMGLDPAGVVGETFPPARLAIPVLSHLVPSARRPKRLRRATLATLPASFHDPYMENGPRVLPNFLQNARRVSAVSLQPEPSVARIL